MAHVTKDLRRERAATEALDSPDLAQFALGGTESGSRWWESTPTLAWVEDASGHVCHCDTECRLSNPVTGAAPLIEGRAGPPGREQHYLVTRFPFRSGESLCMGNVALDITRHMERLDELLHLAVEDELTGLYNRRGFLLFAEHELRVARRRLTHSAVIFIDIDGLKDINDRFGHERGDAALVETARVLRDVFRECDVIARLGGDEFAVFAADVHGDPEAMRMRLWAHLATWRDAPGIPEGLRISAGLGYCHASQSKTLGQLLSEADVAMYADKARRGQAP